MIGAIIAKRKARSSFDCLNRRELHAFLRDWADDATFVYPGNLSVSGTMEGKPAIDDWFQKFMTQFPDLTRCLLVPCCNPCLTRRPFSE